MISTQLFSLAALIAAQPGLLQQPVAPEVPATDEVAETAPEPAPEAAPEEAPETAPEAAPEAEGEAEPAAPAEAEQTEEAAAEEQGAEAAEEAPAAEETAEETPELAVTASEAATPEGATPEKESAAEAAEEEEPEYPPTKMKPGTGFILTTADEKHSIGIRLRIQFRNETLITEEEDEAGELESAVFNSFGIRRARVQFKGHMFGKNNKYKAEFAFSPRDLGLKPVDLGREDGNPRRTPLLTYYTEHTQLRDLSLRLGQYKLLYSRQRVISSGNQEFVDRSEAQGEFNLDRDIGFHFFSKDLGGLELFKYYAGATIGEGRDIWESENLVNGEDLSYQLLGRFEFLPFGHFKDYSEGDFKRLDKVRVSMGGAYAYLNNGRRKRGYQDSAWADGGTVDYQNVAADILLKWKGLSAFAEFYYREGERDVGDFIDEDTGNPYDPTLPELQARSGLGGTFQLGYVLPKAPVNFGARYSTVTRGGFSDSDTSLDENSELGATVGFFPGGHPFKIQADYFHLWGDDFAGGQADRVRLQMQVAY